MKSLNPAAEPADLAAVLPVYRAYFAEAVPGFPEAGEARLRFWTSDGAHSYRRTFGVFADDAEDTDAPALAAVSLGFDLEENRDLANTMVLLPSALRETEVGASLLRETLRLAAAEGRGRVLIEGTSAADPTGFLTGLGGKKVMTMTRSQLDLTGVDRARYAAWAAGSPKNAGYRLVRWVDHCPEELVGSFSLATTAMDDAPMEDLAFEHPEPDVERLRQDEAHSVRYGMRRHVQAAVDAAGEVVAFHMFLTAPDEPEVVDIWDTGVIRAHRGHGLGLRIKAAATLWALEEHPRARWVHTFNNHGNTHMLDVNRTMGYQAAEDWYGFEFATGA